MSVCTTLDLPLLTPFKIGKVRHVYDLGDETLLIVATDRLSAFDVIFDQGIPEKGKVLTQTTQFWCDFFKESLTTHLISTKVQDFPAITMPYWEVLAGRSMWVKKTELIEIECVARGYLAGSGWKEYLESGTVCGVPLPTGLRLADKLPEPIFTPAYKAPMGEHDENITFAQLVDIVGDSTAEQLKKMTLSLFKRAQEYAATKGLILADTKFEFGMLGSEIILIDEVLTPDSSRYWDAAVYVPGSSPPSFDKQGIRDFVENSGWDKRPPAPALPEEIIEKTAKRYQEVYERLST